MSARGAVRIGTSGWTYDHWRGTVYPDAIGKGERLAWLSARLPAVEVNATFYGLPSTETVHGWCEATPRGFRFAVKASRYVTHQKKLRDPEEPLRRLYEAVDAFGDRAGPVLYQLPGRWRSDPARLDAFLSVVPPRPRPVLELRDPSWFADEVLEVLVRHDAAFCIWELAGERSPREVTTDLVYVRLHGPGDEPYTGSYDARTLEGWAGAVSTWARQGRDVWVFFDNDERGNAAQDALALRRMLDDQPDFGWRPAE